MEHAGDLRETLPRKVEGQRAEMQQHVVGGAGFDATAGSARQYVGTTGIVHGCSFHDLLITTFNIIKKYSPVKPPACSPRVNG